MVEQKLRERGLPEHEHCHLRYWKMLKTYVHIYPYSFNLVGAEDSSLCNSCPSPLGLRVSEAAARVGGGRSLPEPERAEAGPRLSWGRGQRPSCSSGAAETVVSDRREVTQSGRSSDSDTVTQ